MTVSRTAPALGVWLRRSAVLLFTIAAIAAAADNWQLYTAASAPSVNIRRVTALNGNVVAADFDGDGRPDLVAVDGADDLPLRVMLISHVTGVQTPAVIDDVRIQR